jgi:DNA-directed RNA polymerase specialized sigma24 family protein
MIEAHTREDDERILTVLALRDRGIPASEIGRRVGWTADKVRSLATRIRNAMREDCA